MAASKLLIIRGICRLFACTQWFFGGFRRKVGAKMGQMQENFVGLL